MTQKRKKIVDTCEIRTHALREDILTSGILIAY